MDERPIDDGSDIEPLPDEILAELRAVPVDELARERAIIAALAEAPRTTRRAASPLPLAGAAAAVVLLAGGAVLLSARSGDDADLAIEQQVAMEADTAEAVAADPAADQPAESASREIDDEAAEELTTASEEFDAEETESAAMDEVLTAEADDVMIDPEGAIVPEELLDEALAALSAIQAGELDPPDTDCVMIGGGPVAVTRFRGVEVVLFLDLANATVTALSVEDCSFVVDLRADS